MYVVLFILYVSLLCFYFSASSSVLLYRLVDNTQELGKIKAKEGESIDFDRYPVGTMLFIYPFHVSRTLAYMNCAVHIPLSCKQDFSLVVP